MNLLAIETVTEHCSVALSWGGQTTQHYRHDSKGHSNAILRMVETVCNEADVAISDLDAIAVDVGPGSFTGVRVGIGVAQGLAYAAGKSIIAVESLSALAAVESGLILPAVDARMQQIYFGLYRNRDGVQQCLVPPAVAFPDDISLSFSDQDALVTGLGSGWDVYESVLDSKVRQGTYLSGRYPEARFVVEIAQQRGLQEAIDPMLIQACYVRNQVANKAR